MSSVDPATKAWADEHSRDSEQDPESEDECWNQRGGSTGLLYESTEAAQGRSDTEYEQEPSGHPVQQIGDGIREFDAGGLRGHLTTDVRVYSPKTVDVADRSDTFRFQRRSMVVHSP